MRFIVVFLALLAFALQPAQAASSPNLTTLEQQLRSVLSGASSDVGVAALDLTTGTLNPDGADSTPYDRLVASFSNPFVTAFYAIAVILLGMHLRHGIWSATQTLGQSNRRREKTVNLFAIAFATVLTLGFLLVPFSVLFGLID